VTPAADEEEPEEEATAEPEPDDGKEPSGGSGEVDGNTYVLELNGAEIAWVDPWEFDDSLNSVEDDFESMGLVGGTYIQSILFLPTGVDLEESRDAFLEGFAGDDIAVQEIDRGAYDNVSYSLDRAQISDVIFGLFTVYIDDGENVRSFATLAPEANLGDAVDLAATTITIDGEPIYSGVTGSGLQDLIRRSRDTRITRRRRKR
jgi:hypothetical protein